MLETKGQEAFLPLYRNSHRYARREKVFHLPWFPGYVFCRFNLGMCRPVVTTPGVIRVLGSGSDATPIEDSEMASLQIAVKTQTAVEACPFMQAGEKVQITEGALAGVEGILIQVKQAPRIVLSVSLLQRSVLLEIDREMVARSVPNGFSGK
jgi:transcription antitermination factor NusG